MVILRFFASSRDRAGISMIEIDVSSIKMLKRYLIEHFDKLTEEYLSKCRFACNNKYIDDTFELTENDQIMLLPPVSGG